MKYLFVALILFLTPLAYVSAHLAGGEDVTIGKYMIDFGYEPEQAQVLIPTLISFNLLDDVSKQPASFDSMWVRVSAHGEIYFTGTLKQEADNVLFRHTFPKEGEYEITARFMDERGKVLVEHDFLLPVQEGTVAPALDEEIDSQLYMIAIFLVLLANGLFLYWYTRVNNTHKITR